MSGPISTSAAESAPTPGRIAVLREIVGRRDFMTAAAAAIAVVALAHYWLLLQVSTLPAGAESSDDRSEHGPLSFASRWPPRNATIGC